MLGQERLVRDVTFKFKLERASMKASQEQLRGRVMRLETEVKVAEPGYQSSMKDASKPNAVSRDEGEIDQQNEESKEVRRGNGQSAQEAAMDEVAKVGKFKCKTCVESFVSKKTYEKHRKSKEHKEKEVKIKGEKDALEAAVEAKRLEKVRKIEATNANRRATVIIEARRAQESKVLEAERWN